jgi:hypothetical protein
VGFAERGSFRVARPIYYCITIIRNGMPAKTMA